MMYWIYAIIWVYFLRNYKLQFSLFLEKLSDRGTNWLHVLQLYLRCLIFFPFFLPFLQLPREGTSSLLYSLYDPDLKSFPVLQAFLLVPQQGWRRALSGNSSATTGHLWWTNPKWNLHNTPRICTILLLQNHLPQSPSHANVFSWPLPLLLILTLLRINSLHFNRHILFISHHVFLKVLISWICCQHLKIGYCTLKLGYLAVSLLSSLLHTPNVPYKPAQNTSRPFDRACGILFTVFCAPFLEFCV